MRHKSNNKTRPLFTLSLEMTRLVNKTRLLLVPCFNSDIYGYSCTFDLNPCRAKYIQWSMAEEVVMAVAAKSRKKH